MNIDESEPSTSSGQERGTRPGAEQGRAALSRARRWRPRSVVVAASVGALVIGCGVTGVAATTRVFSVHSVAAAPATSVGTNATLLPQRGVSGAINRATQTTATGFVTNAQSAGIVIVDSALAYQGEEAAGTGIVLTSNGEILTNNHVINGATSISVTVSSTGATYTADVIGTDPTSDIAVLQLVGASGLRTAALERTSPVAISAAVTAVGNAGGTGSLTAAAGTVTAVDQTITAAGESGSNPETLNGLIETNADVIPGDSGGPLYDARGAIIGIDTAASSGSSATSGSSAVTGFAIPISTALHVASRIDSGVANDQITVGYPAFLGVAVGGSTTTTFGAPITGVVSGTPAESAGLVAGDTITTVDGLPISSDSQLSSLLASHAPGDSVTIGWTDAVGSANSATVQLAQGAAN